MEHTECSLLSHHVVGVGEYKDGPRGASKSLASLFPASGHMTTTPLSLLPIFSSKISFPWLYFVISELEAAE